MSAAKKKKKNKNKKNNIKKNQNKALKNQNLNKTDNALKNKNSENLNKTDEILNNSNFENLNQKNNAKDSQDSKIARNEAISSNNKENSKKDNTINKTDELKNSKADIKLEVNNKKLDLNNEKSTDNKIKENNLTESKELKTQDKLFAFFENLKNIFKFNKNDSNSKVEDSKADNAKKKNKDKNDNNKKNKNTNEKLVNKVDSKTENQKSNTPSEVKENSENLNTKEKGKLKEKTKENLDKENKTKEKINAKEKANKETNENENEKANTNEEVKEKEKSNEETSEKANKQIKAKSKTNKKEDNTKNEADDKPEYVQKMIKNRKRKVYIFICIAVLVILIILFSTIFAIMNLNNTNIVEGVNIKGVDVSNLSTEDAKTKLEENLATELTPEISLKYNDYEITLKPEQIEFSYNIDEAVNEAYSVARSNNIVINNYKLLTTSAFGDDIKINYEYNEELLNQFVDGINSELPGVVVEPSYYMENNQLIISKGTDGIQVQKDNLKELILSTIYNRTIDEVTGEDFKDEIEIPIEEAKASDIDIEAIYAEIHTEPQDAYYETDPYEIYPDVDGVDLAISVEEAKAQIEAEDKDEYTFDLNITKASKTINDLGTEAFPYLVSSFSTKYDASNVNRSTNLKIAAEKINGTVLMPGEEFSYNKVVGKRTVEEGYKDAAIYADGGVVDGLAGGICQISSTLYNAVLLANLEVTERRNHTYTTSYVAAGRDATVVWGTKDFKFINSRSYPIKIEASVSNGIAEFKIHGVQEEKEYEVKILPVTTGTIPYSTSYVEDATLAAGVQVVSQNGHLGYKVTTYKELIYNGEVVSKEVISNDTYSSMQTIIRVGTGTATQ